MSAKRSQSRSKVSGTGTRCAPSEPLGPSSGGSTAVGNKEGRVQVLGRQQEKWLCAAFFIVVFTATFFPPTETH